MSDASSALIEALAEYVEAGQDALVAARKSLSVSELEARAIRSIGAHPGIRPSLLREHLDVTSAGVTTLVDRLVGRGVLRRELDVEDRRVNHIFLEVDLDAEPWSALGRFDTEVHAAIRAESSEAFHGFADLLRRVTARAQARI
ncbi:MarR family winged helix-turn-helix transcriptional regulator [Microbacterium testaceum]|jgi:DNA-binding MarR family transcriptional regulator|uniref:MarR family winged helix-turn-helix transcriptional regulator n=1 Tax=Microbacterium testaceum TaxID=2033 RepID=UPI00073497ED|nr:helix-turn-helix domain-containing protein [Microbacterium testaceum]